MTTAGHRRQRLQRVTEHASVTPLELFFDLVFVFALTQITALMAEDPTARGVIRGLLILAVLWWSWVGYAWLGNVVRADEGVTRLAMFGAMTALFVIALAIPEAFEDLPGGLPGPVVSAVGYFLVRLAHLCMFLAASRTDPGLRRQVIKFTPSVLVATSLLLIASQLSGSAQILVWAAALLADLGGTMLAGASGWRVNSAAHFAERHALILIVALGESIVSIGIGVAELPTWPIVAASVLGLVLSGALWWSYFDTKSIAAEHALGTARGEHRARLARDGYSYLHLPMIAGIILLSLGLKKVLGYVGGEDDHVLSDQLYGLPLIALYGGVSLYLLAHAAFIRRLIGVLSLSRLLLAAGLLAGIPIAAELPALVSLAALSAAVAVGVGLDSWRHADVREDIRHHDEPPPA
ncbi:MAG: low temperature requirement protein A [Geodermatophilaceae bacterium]|nr:low temperature requirement protein A [Geodermatophilaceae bacterium]